MKKYLTITNITLLGYFLLALICALSWVHNGNIYGTDDIYSLFRDNNYLQKAFFFWEDQKSFGALNVGFSRVFFDLVEFYVNSNFIDHIIFFFLNIFLSLLFCFFFIKKFFAKLNYTIPIEFVSLIPLYYVFAPFSYYYIFQDQTGYQWLLPFAPFFLFFYIKILFRENIYLSLIALFIGSIIFGPALSQIFLFVLGLFTVALTLIFYKKINIRLFLNLILIFLLWAWFLFPSIYSVGNSLALANKAGTANNLISLSSEFNSMLNTVRFTGYSPINFMAQHDGVFLNTEGNYYKSALWLIISIAEFGLIIYYSFFSKSRELKKTLPIVILYVLILFLITNISYPITSLIPVIRNGLRNTYHKISLYYQLVFAMLLIISFYETLKLKLSNKYIFLFLALGLIPFSYPFLISSPIYRGGIVNSYYVNIPPDYADFYENSTVNKSENQKILLLPLNRYGTTFFIWASPVEDLILDQYTDNSVSSIRYINQTSIQITDTLWSDIQNGNYEKFVNDTSSYNISSIVFDKNINWSYYADLNQGDPLYIPEAEYEKLENFLETKYPFHFFGNIEEFVFSNPVSVIQSSNITYQKLSPVEYLMTVYNLSSERKITLTESFDSNWRLYPIGFRSTSCTSDNMEMFPQSVTECLPSLSKFDIGDVSYLLNHSYISSQEDVTTYNTWILSKQTVANNFSTIKVENNPDGSINATFVIYFFPQSYFYLGVIISLLVFMAICAALLFSSRRN